MQAKGTKEPRSCEPVNQAPVSQMASHAIGHAQAHSNIYFKVNEKDGMHGCTHYVLCLSAQKMQGGIPRTTALTATLAATSGCAA